MTNAPKHGNTAGHGGFERQDLRPAGIVYFLLGLGVVTVISLFLLRGVFSYLERRDRARQTSISPLVNNLSEDTRHVPRGYPQDVFPNPKLEEDERGQLNDIRIEEENKLNSYGWVDEKAGTVRIPIERAMDLMVERGMPVRGQSSASGNESARPSAAVKKTEKK